VVLAERRPLPTAELDVEQMVRYLDHTAWTAIAAVEDAIGEIACVRLAATMASVPPSMRQRWIGLALRSLEGTLRFGRPDASARDAAWAVAVLDGDGADLLETNQGTVIGGRLEAVYDALQEAIQQVAPSAEHAAQQAIGAILDEAAAIVEGAGGQVAISTALPAATPIPSLAFRGLADLPYVAYVVDRSLRYAYVNHAWEAFARENDGSSCLAPAVIGRSWIDAISGPDRQHWLAVAEQLLDGTIPSYREEIPCHSSSDCRFIVVTASPLKLDDDDLEVAGLIFLTYDVTDLRQAETDRLWLDQEGRRVRDVFLGTVAHDLRNPLTTIKGRTQLLRLRAARSETPLAGGIEDSLVAIEATADQMVGQIDELLDVAQVQAGQPTRMRSRSTDLVALVRGVMLAHEHLLAGHRLLLKAPPEPIVGIWDDVRIRRVAANLISNAVKYSPDGGEIVVAVSRERIEDRAWAVCSVQDQGIGIPSADLPSIFSSFFRGSNVDERTGGFGLGLAGAHQIVTQHGGHIEVASEVGAGTTFTVYLPLDE
jgi:signal transduction histidine kinase